MYTFCTIITANYLPFAKVLYTSLAKREISVKLQVLVVDGNNFVTEENLFIHQTQDLVKDPVFTKIEKKYAHTNSDYFRWALKPIFISYLLGKEYEKVIFVDPDIYFVSNYDFLVNELDNASVLLSPHWISIEPSQMRDALIQMFRGGLFNAGFIGVSKKGLAAMKWWAEACHYNIEKQPQIGIFVDQKYLDILPVEFEDVKILKHKGCNLAEWNMNSCKRTIKNGQLLILGQYEPIFIHFTKDTIRHITNMNDYLLKQYLDEYMNLLNEKGADEKLLKGLPAHTDRFYISNKIKRKLLIRTRLKRWLLRLSEKL